MEQLLEPFKIITVEHHPKLDFVTCLVKDKYRYHLVVADLVDNHYLNQDQMTNDIFKDRTGTLFIPVATNSNGVYDCLYKVVSMIACWEDKPTSEHVITATVLAHEFIKSTREEEHDEYLEKLGINYDKG